jgi:4-hydroxybutyrate CoA-transferase
MKALLARYTELRAVEVVKLLELGADDFFTSDMAQHIHVNNLFIGASQREAVNAGLADFTPVFLSDNPRLFA